MNDPQIKLPGLFAIIGLCALIALLGYISETKRAHAKQIAQLSVNCPR